MLSLVEAFLDFPIESADCKKPPRSRSEFRFDFYLVSQRLFISVPRNLPFSLEAVLSGPILTLLALRILVYFDSMIQLP